MSKHQVTMKRVLLLMLTGMVCCCTYAQTADPEKVVFVPGYQDAEGVFHSGYYKGAGQSVTSLEAVFVFANQKVSQAAPQTIGVVQAPESPYRMASSLTSNSLPFAVPNKTFGQESR